MRAIAEVATAVTKGDLTRSIQVDARGEVAELKDNINTMIGNLRLTTDHNTEQDWLKTNLAKFTNMLQGQRDLASVGRMLLSELNRMSSHLLFMATNGMDIGAVSMMIYGWREREQVLRFFQKVTGLRMNHNFIRPGGLAADLPAGWRDDVLSILDEVEPRLEEYDVLMTGQPIWRERLQGVGIITAQEAIALGATGPILRSTGVAWDLRRDQPYLKYDEVDFDVIVGSYGDAFDRYAIRLNEIRESMRIVRQILDRMPSGDYRIQDKKVTPPPRARIDESMEALIHHFKIFTEGFKVPEGEVYVGIESPRGEIGCYIVSDGTSNPYRMHVRAPSFVNIQTLPHMMRGGLVADAVAVISSIASVTSSTLSRCIAG